MISWSDDQMSNWPDADAESALLMLRRWAYVHCSDDQMMMLSIWADWQMISWSDDQMLISVLQEWILKGLASHCYSKTTFTFHFSILNIFKCFHKSKSGVSLAIASQPFLERFKSVMEGFIFLSTKIYVKAWWHRAAGVGIPTMWVDFQPCAWKSNHCP